MDPLKLQTIIDVLDGEWLPLGAGASRSPETSVARVSTDSRSLDAAKDGETLFVALSGDRFDAHDFLPEIASTVRAALVAESEVDRVRASAAHARDGMGALVVRDPLDSLTRLAAWYRARLPATVIGITGSVGKTTVKEFLGQVLARSFPTVRAAKSFNNRIGLSLTLLAADQKTRFVVAELGTSAPGEIAELTRIAAPDFAVVTGVASAHLNGLGDLDGVAREKAGIFEGLQSGGSAFISAPIHCEGLFLDRASQHAGHVHRIGWALDSKPSDGDYPEGDHPEGDYPEDIWITRCDRALASTARTSEALVDTGFRFEVNHRYQFDLPLPGRHNAFNALVAISVARECGVEWASLREAVAELRLPPLRLQLSTSGGVTILDDTYNANPMSVRGALQAVRDLRLPEGGRWQLVLGDLLELGDSTSLFHRRLGEEIAGSGTFSHLWAVGDEARHTAKAAAERGLETRSLPASETDRLVKDLLATLRPGDGVLFKASRGLALDASALKLRELLGDEAPDDEAPGDETIVDRDDRRKSDGQQEKDQDEKGGQESSHGVLSL